MKKNIFFLLFIFLSIINVNAKTNDNQVNIYFFHSDTCSHCREEIKFLKELETRYKNINIYKYEIHDKNNHVLLKEVEKNYDITINSVPLTIIGNKLYNGYSENSKVKFIKTIDYFSKYSYEDKIGKYLNLDLVSNNIKSTKTLDEFIDSYYNYSLLGIKTDNLDWNGSALLIGLSLSLNIITLISIFIIILFSLKLKNSFLLKMIYIFINTIILILSLSFNMNFLLKIVLTIILWIIVFGLMVKQNKNNSKWLFIIFICVSFCSFLCIRELNNYLLIIKNIMYLHNLNGFNKIIYYGDIVAVSFIINFLIMIFVDNFIKIIKVKKEKIHLN